MSEPEENTEHIFQDLQGLPDAILRDPDEWLFGEHTTIALQKPVLDPEHWALMWAYENKDYALAAKIHRTRMMRSLGIPSSIIQTCESQNYVSGQAVFIAGRPHQTRILLGASGRGKG